MSSSRSTSVFVAMVRGHDREASGCAVDEHRVHEDHRRRAARPVRLVRRRRRRLPVHQPARPGAHAGGAARRGRPVGRRRRRACWRTSPRSPHAIGAAVREIWQPPRVGLLVAGFEVPHLHVHVFPAWDMAAFDFANAAPTRGRRRAGRPPRHPAGRAARRRARRARAGLSRRGAARPRAARPAGARAGRIGGKADPPLTPHGRAQADRLVAALGAGSAAGADGGVAGLYTSPMARARDTAAPLAAALGVPPTVVEDLREYDAEVAHYVPVHEMAQLDPGAWDRIRAGLLPAYVDVPAFTARVTGRARTGGRRARGSGDRRGGGARRSDQHLARAPARASPDPSRSRSTTRASPG